MRWARTDNPRVWEASDGRHYAMAQDTPRYSEGGCIGRVFARPLQFSFLDSKPERVGMAMWGADPEAALRAVIQFFDREAELPENEDQKRKG